MKTVRSSSGLCFPWTGRESSERPETSDARKSSEGQGMDYEVYRLSKKEWLLYGSQGIGYLALLDFVFYRSAALFAVLAPMGICYPLILRKDLKRRRKEALKLQFKDAILSAASGLNAGYSVENAFAAAIGGNGPALWEGFYDIPGAAPDPRQDPDEPGFREALGDFARRSGLEDIQSFSEVFLAARKSGGELVRIIARTAEIIAEKIRIQEDIMTATAARRMEQRIMSAIPLLIVFYIELTSPGFFDLLYGTAAGRVVMTVCLGIYLGACSLSKRILEIRI